MNDWVNMLQAKPKAPVVHQKRTKVEPRTPEVKQAIAERVCNQMFRQKPYPPEDECHERLRDEAHLTMPAARKFVADYKVRNLIGGLL